MVKLILKTLKFLVSNTQNEYDRDIGDKILRCQPLKYERLLLENMYYPGEFIDVAFTTLQLRTKISLVELNWSLAICTQGTRRHKGHKRTGHGKANWQVVNKLE